MNRAVFASLTILCLLSTSSIAGLIQVVKADGATITINADGSITPPTAPIYTADNITYTLTGNITAANVDGLDIERDNIFLDGAGYTVTGSIGGNGTTLTNRINVKVRNMKIENFTDGICLVGSSNNTLSGNTVTNNLNSIVLLSSSDSNTLSGNNVTANEFGIYLSSSSYNTLSQNNAAVNTYGIDLSSSSYNTLSGNNATNNEDGIELSSSSGNTLSGNNVSHNGDGIVLLSSPDNILSDNNATNNEDGILLSSSSSNVLSGNNVTANSNYGIWLYSSSNSTLHGNNITANNNYGITLSFSSSNSIFQNNFVNNTNQVSTDGLANIWDDGSRGNYWSDYLTEYPNATQVDSSGVWNTPYVIDTNNTDHYPLMIPYVIPEFPSFLILPLFFIATLLTVIIYKKKGVKTRQSQAEPRENAMTNHPSKHRNL